ncbi:DUF2786 domain-containing protein [Corynebacterium sp. 35RC1]|nr:DUF2786 domain-containing protein [Corynebacterium sp. 35RC1]
MKMHIADIKDKVAKLLRQAADQEGTPEGAVFQEKAFELMAKYGVEVSQLEEEQPRGAQAHHQYLYGAYTDLQCRLLAVIAMSLHCVVVCHTMAGKQRINVVSVFGLPQHLFRVQTLFELLNPTMLTGAQEYRRHRDFPNGGYTRRAKRSWMIGFTHTIGTRLQAIEHAYTEHFARGGRSGELVLQSDLEQAQQAAHECFPESYVAPNKGVDMVDSHAFRHGKETGDRQDLGQQRVPPRQFALEGR